MRFFRSTNTAINNLYLLYTYISKLCTPTAYEIYRNDIPTLTDFKAAAEALVSDPSAYTFVDEHRFKVEGGNYYEALLTGVADKGEVVLFNVGTGKAVDCNLAS